MEDTELKLYSIPDQTETQIQTAGPNSSQSAPDFSASQASQQLDNTGQTKLSQGAYQSSNFSTGTQGWQLRPDGAEFFNLVATNSIITQSFTAQEAITAGQAVCIGDGLSYVQAVLSSSTANNHVFTTTSWIAGYATTDPYQITISRITAVLNADVNIDYSITVSIRADDGAGKPTGADLVSLQQTINIGGSDGAFGFIFATPLTVTPNTKYHAIIRRSGAEGHNVRIHEDTQAFPASVANSSTDSGVTWTNDNGPSRLTFYGTETTLGQVSLTTALTNRARTTNFIGFAYETKSAGQTIRIAVAGTATASSLTGGLFYYLSDTLGAIASSVGTNTRKVGIALSSTKLLITNIW